MPLYGWLWLLTLIFVVATLACMVALLVEKGKRTSCRPYFTPMKLPTLAKQLHGDACSWIELLLWSFLFVTVAIAILAIGATLFHRRPLVVVEE